MQINYIYLMESKIGIVCLKNDAFYALVDKVIEHIDKKFSLPKQKWISGEEAMRLLQVSSKTTLQNLRDEGKIRFSQPQKKIILYDVDSIREYIDKHARNTF